MYGNLLHTKYDVNHSNIKGINKVKLIGNTGKDPEYKTLQDGTPVAKVTLATTESYRLKNGESQPHTEWHTVIAWRGLATFAHQYILFTIEQLMAETEKGAKANLNI